MTRDSATPLLRYTLLADGPSDRCLLRVIDSLLDGIPRIAESGFLPQFAGPREVRSAEPGLVGRMRRALQEFPCDILFVHRDAEREPLEHRVQEVERATSEVGFEYVVPVVPVRMTEAWLLIDAKAIRRAADNPNGSVTISLPRTLDLETVPDPKKVLFDLLVRASEKKGRRLEQLKSPQNLSTRWARVATLIEDFSPLASLPAFQAFRRRTLGLVSRWLESLPP